MNTPTGNNFETYHIVKHSFIKIGSGTYLRVWKNEITRLKYNSLPLSLITTITTTTMITPSSACMCAFNDYTAN